MGSRVTAPEGQGDRSSGLLDPASALREEILRQHNELQILFDISSAIHRSPRLEDVLHQSLMAILRTFRLKMGAIYLLRKSDSGFSMNLAAQHGFSSALVDVIRTFPVSQKWVEEYHRREPVTWFRRKGIFFPALRQRMREDKIEEIIRIGLHTQKGVLGLLYVANHGALQVRPDRGEFLTTIGQQIGVAIENAKLFDSVQRAKTELEITFDAIQHSIFLIDSDGIVLRVNRTGESVYGPAPTIVGRRYDRILYGEGGLPETCPVLECLRAKRPIQREGAHPRWGGFYRFSAFPVLSISDRLERVVYYEKDETEAKRLQERLQQSERLKSLGTLAAGIAHEIRNPLATINFNAQMLQRDLDLDDGRHQMLDDMVQEIRKIDTIVRQVLNFARPRDPQKIPSQLNEIIRYCYNLAKVHSRKSGVQWDLQLADQLPLVTMDSDQISQVIMNLIINAIEAMPDGGFLTIRTQWMPESRHVRMDVIDTGEGILPEDETRIFDPFYTRKAEGTGLGLSICRQILDQHGAQIEMESKRGQGTTFRVLFTVEPDTEVDHRT